MLDRAKQITQLLRAVEAGDGSANEELVKLVYPELRAIAARRMRAEGNARTMQATALCHEAYIKLVDSEGQLGNWDNRRHFFSAAAEAMRQVLVDYARKSKAAKRGGGQRPVALDEEQLGLLDAPIDVLDLHELVDRLATQDPEKAEIVKLRFFAGLTVDETAELRGVSRRKVQLDWQFTKAWLLRELNREVT